VRGPVPYSSPERGIAPPSNGGTPLVEAAWVWALFVVAAVAVFVTYSRISAEDLYNVSGTGLEGGASRALVFLGYPTSFAAIAVVAVVSERLRGVLEAGAAAVAVLLCLTIVIPGVVDQGDLDARPVNALAAVGVGIALVLTGIALGRGGLGRTLPSDRADLVRLLVGGILLFAALPWLAAEAGFYIDAVPGLDPIFMSEELHAEGGEHAAHAVHLGDHHGTDGVLLAWTALALSRVLPTLRRRGTQIGLAVYLALMLVYGLALALEDFWLEQLYKRDVTSIRLPNMIRPDASPAWAGILAATVLAAVLLFRLARVEAPGRRI
jgi:hypothetical protein